MTNPDKPTVGDLTARLEFRYENDPLDFLKTGKGYLVVDDKVATIPLPTGEKGEKGDTGRLAEGDVRYFNHRTEEAEAAAEASEVSAGRSKASEEAAKASETKAKTSETNAKDSETKASKSASDAHTYRQGALTYREGSKEHREAAEEAQAAAKSSETKAKASEEESAVQAELSAGAASLAITAAATVAQYVGDGFPEGKVTAPVGSIYTDRQATAGAIRWIKTSGTGSTGWQVEYGDTGWRDISEEKELDYIQGDFFVRRVGSQVHFSTQNFHSSEDTTYAKYLIRIPSGFRRGSNERHVTLLVNGSAKGDPSVIYYTDPYRVTWLRRGFDSPQWPVADESQSGTMSYLTEDLWPITLPGTPA